MQTVDMFSIKAKLSKVVVGVYSIGSHFDSLRKLAEDNELTDEQFAQLVKISEIVSSLHGIINPRR